MAPPFPVRTINQVLLPFLGTPAFNLMPRRFLFQLDKSPEVVESGQRRDRADRFFRRTDPANYLSLALELGTARRECFNRLLPGCCCFPNAIIHISEHSLDLDSDTAALFLYGSMDSAKASKAADCAAPGRRNRSWRRRPAAHLLAEEMTEGKRSAL